MWTYSGELIQQSPWIGHGFDASRVYDDLTFRAPDGRDIVAAVGLWQHWWWALIVLAVSLISLIPSKMNAI